jgi:hypothetical protein
MAATPRTPSLQPSCHPAYPFLLLHSARQRHVDGEVFFLLQYSCFVSELLIFESETVGLAEVNGSHDVFMTKSELTR